MATEIVGRYELLRPLGAGGMGEVFLARDHMLERLVAVKRVNADHAAAKSVLHEARIVAALDHANIAAVFDVVEHRGQPHVVMEYVEGPTLQARLDGGPLSEGDVINYGRQIADALAYAHARNIVHCDIKPSNVMLTPDDVPKVLDFGIARRDTPSGAGVSTTASIRGTPAYMAPEVLSGAAATYQSDIFSLGVMLYELAVGRRPFERGSSSLSADAIEKLSSRVSRELTGIILRAIEADPSKRFQGAEELRISLSRIAAATTITSVVVRRKSTAAGKTIALLGGLAAVCATLVLGLPRVSSTAATTPSVLGVMMFNNTGDESNEYLAAGMADVLVSQLADAPGITIVPRSATAALTKESQIADAVKSLGLTHVIAGSVQRSGASLRMTISLLGDKGATVKWSRSFDGLATDVFHLEQRIGQTTLQALRNEGLVSSTTVAQALNERPTANADAFDDYAHGRALFERTDVPGNADRALTFFQRAVSRDPGFARAHAAIGEVSWWKYVDTRDTSWIDKARAAMLSAMRLAPDDPSVGFTMAVIDQGTGQSENAIAALEQVLRNQPAFDAAHRLLGRIYSENGNFDKAIEEFREAQSLRPEYPATVRDLGLAYYDKGRLDEAIAAFTKLTALQPDNASAYQTLGTALHAAKQYDRALVAYRQAIALAPRPSAYSNIGTIHYARREYDHAIEAYRQAIKLQPREPTTHRNLADALWMKPDRAAAVAEYERAIQLANDVLAVNPKAPRFPALVAYCHAKSGRVVMARQLIAKVVAAAPDDSDAAYKQGVIEAIAGNHGEAIRYIGRALQLGYSRALVENDRDLDGLRSLPDFARLGLP